MWPGQVFEGIVEASLLGQGLVFAVHVGMHHVPAANVFPAQALVADVSERIAERGRAGFGKADYEDFRFEVWKRLRDFGADEDDDGEQKDWYGEPGSLHTGPMVYRKCGTM
jgi:hypothetical protein